VGIEGFTPQTHYLLNIPIKDTVWHTWVIIGLLIGFAIWAYRRVRVWEPKTWQLAVEWVIEYVQGLVRDMSGRSVPEVMPLLITMISFIAIANLFGLVPSFYAPTRDMSTTLALSLVAFGASQYYGISKRGIGGYIKSFFEPVVFMLPLNLIGLVSRILSMALRLFGNVIAGELIGTVVFALVKPLAPLPLSLLSSITGVLQALVFTILSLVFILDAMGNAEESVALTQATKPSITD
jgi:F-type H+-transporting ATPase subunit a